MHDQLSPGQSLWFIEYMMDKTRSNISENRWVLAVFCPFLPYDYQMLLAALALLTSYIIPGYLLGSNKK